MKRKMMISIVAVATASMLMVGCGQQAVYETAGAEMTEEVNNAVEDVLDIEETEEIQNEEIETEEVVEEKVLEDIDEEMVLAESVLKEVYKVLSAKSVEGIWAIDDSEDAKRINEYMKEKGLYAICYSSEDDKIVENFTGKGAAIYSIEQGYYFYEGDIVNDIKSGVGIAGVKYTEAEIFIYCDGQWENDRPNGQVTKVTTYLSDESTFNEEERGKCVNGIFEGKVDTKLILKENSEYYEYGPELIGVMSCVNGIVQHDSESDKVYDPIEGIERVLYYSNDMSELVTAYRYSIDEPVYALVNLD